MPWPAQLSLHLTLLVSSKPPLDMAISWSVKFYTGLQSQRFCNIALSVKKIVTGNNCNMPKCWTLGPVGIMMSQLIKTE